MENDDEDKYVNVEVGMECGFEGFLIEHGHNLNYKGDATIVKNWEQIYDALAKRN